MNRKYCGWLLDFISSSSHFRSSQSDLQPCWRRCDEKVPKDGRRAFEAFAGATPGHAKKMAPKGRSRTHTGITKRPAFMSTSYPASRCSHRFTSLIAAPAGQASRVPLMPRISLSSPMIVTACAESKCARPVAIAISVTCFQTAPVIRGACAIASTRRLYALSRSRISRLRATATTSTFSPKWQIECRKAKATSPGRVRSAPGDID